MGSSFWNQFWEVVTNSRLEFEQDSEMEAAAPVCMKRHSKSSFRVSLSRLEPTRSLTA